MREGGIAKLAHQSGRLLGRHYQRIEIPTVPFGNGPISLDEMGFAQIEEQRFVLRGNDFVTPMIRLRFMANLASENDESAAMIAISGDDFRNRVPAGS